MSIIVIGGSRKDSGKTTLVCGVVAALREFGWTAVKITGHDYEPANSAASRAGISKQTIFEETSAGAETDTALYLAAGARRALLVSRFGVDVPMEDIRKALAGDRNIIFESNWIVDAVKPDVCLAVLGGARSEMKPSFLRLLRVADALVSVGGAEEEIVGAPPGIPRFALQSLDSIPPEMESWLRERLHHAERE